MKRITQTFLLGFLFYSCGAEQPSSIDIEGESPSNKLSQEKALSILQEEYTGDGCSGRVSSYTNAAFNKINQYTTELALFEELSNAGLVELNIGYSKFGYNEASISCTEESIKKYKGFKESGSGTPWVLITQEYATKVLGISHNEDETEATVLFETISKETPFYIIATENGREKCPLGDLNEREATFIKYDTGWKLKKED
ncbi:MAG: hypothetical protein IT222_02225 [Crocinitomix sp.]|nr:hypothetical protein [Crocinitomix sp.]